MKINIAFAVPDDYRMLRLKAAWIKGIFSVTAKNIPKNLFSG